MVCSSIKGKSGDRGVYQGWIRGGGRARRGKRSGDRWRIVNGTGYLWELL